MSQQKGFLLVTAVIVIVVFALLSAALVSTVLRTAESTLYLRQIPAASALAESGLEQAKQSMTFSNLSTRQTCAGLSTTTILSTGTSATGRGSLTVDNPRFAFSTLATAISSADVPSTITVNDSSVFASNGWVLIGREVFQYDYIASGTTLGGVSRAQDGTEARGHVVGTVVSQYQCAIAGTGYAPATNTKSTREYQQGLRQPALFAAGLNGTILRWNGQTSELLWSSDTTGTANDFHAISMINYHSGWAAGKHASEGFVFSRLQGNTWSTVYAPLGSETDLHAIHATSEQEAWAVGERTGGNTIAILRWVRNASNASNNWCRVPCGGITLTESGVKPIQKSIYGIKMLDLNGDGYANVGYAVGGSHDQSAKEGVIWYYSGTGWSPIDKAPLNFTFPADVSRLVGLDLTANGSSAPKEAFFVGHSGGSAGGKLVRLRVSGGVDSWAIVDTTEDLKAVSVIDTNGDGYADFGCAVGNNGTVIFFDSNLNASTTTLASSGNDLTGVQVLSATDIWVVGNAGFRFHFDGSTWTLRTANVTTGVNLMGLSGIFPQQTALSHWHELMR